MVTKRREDTSEGCRGLANDDRLRAAVADSSHMRRTLERSAAAWTGRANLLERLAREFSERAEKQAQRRLERNDNG